MNANLERLLSATLTTPNFTIAASDGALTRQADGTYLAIWVSGSSISGQVFDADGSHVGGQFDVTSGATAYADVSATLLSNGDTIVTWVEAGTIKALRLGADRQPVGDASDLGASTALNQHSPKAYDLGSGNYTVLYKSTRSSDRLAVLSQTTVTGTTITKDAVASGDDIYHAFTVLNNGTFIIFYNNGHAIQVEDWTNNTPMPSITRTDPAAPINQSAAALDNGKCNVAWQDNASVGGPSVINAQVLNADGTPSGGAVSFTTPPGTVHAVAITQLLDKSFALLLTMDNGTDKDIYVATCSETGTILMPPALVGQSADGDQIDPHVTVLAGSSFAVGWMNSANSTFMTEVFGASTPPENAAPQITNLNGDIINTTPGGTALIDVGSNAVLTDDQDAISSLILNLWDGGGEDHLGIRTEGTGIQLSDSLNPGSKISIGGAEIGVIGAVSGQWMLHIDFSATTTVAQVQQLIRALTYSNSSGAADLVSERHIQFRVVDQSGKFADAALTVEVAQDSANTAPTNLRLTTGDGGTASIDENTEAGHGVATVTADDDNPAGELRYSMEQNANFEINETTGEVKIKAGARLDFETASSHRIKVKVTDQGGLSSERDFTITVGDVLEAMVGTKGKNVLVGGIGADKLYGDYGNDKLSGGAGQDVFVFNARLGTAKTDRKVNFDKITDFTVGEDKIWLDNKVFKKLGKGSEAAPGKLKKAFFEVGTQAGDRNDYLVYNKKTGVLSYDADGSGSKQVIEIAQLKKNLKLSYKDFFIV